MSDEEAEMLEAMKSGVLIRIRDIEAERDALKAEVERLRGQVAWLKRELDGLRAGVPSVDTQLLAVMTARAEKAEADAKKFSQEIADGIVAWARIKAEHDAAKEVLRSVEWAAISGDSLGAWSCCPSCKTPFTPHCRAHADNCRLAAALRDTPAETQATKEMTMGSGGVCHYCGKRDCVCGGKNLSKTGGEPASEVVGHTVGTPEVASRPVKATQAPLPVTQAVVPSVWVHAGEESKAFDPHPGVFVSPPVSPDPTEAVPCSGCGDRGGWEDGDEGQWVVCLKCKPRSENESHMGAQAGIREQDSLGASVRPSVSASVERSMGRPSVEKEAVKATQAPLPVSDHIPGCSLAGIPVGLASCACPVPKPYGLPPPVSPDPNRGRVIQDMLGATLHGSPTNEFAAAIYDAVIAAHTNNSRLAGNASV